MGTYLITIFKTTCGLEDIPAIVQNLNNMKYCKITTNYIKSIPRYTFSIENKSNWGIDPTDPDEQKRLWLELGTEFDSDEYCLTWYPNVLKISPTFRWGAFIADEKLRMTHRYNSKQFSQIFNAHFEPVYHMHDDLFYNIHDQMTETSTFEELLQVIREPYIPVRLTPDLPFPNSWEDLDENWAKYDYNCLVDYFEGLETDFDELRK